jgi:hypothetical protein
LPETEVARVSRLRIEEELPVKLLVMGIMLYAIDAGCFGTERVMALACLAVLLVEQLEL